MNLLALDAATEHCSVALWYRGEMVEREAAINRSAADQILPLIEALFSEAGIALSALDALSFGRGPGAFTGVRLAASIAQGLAYAASLPVIPVSTLRAVAQRALAMAHAPPRVLVCQDARMHEVYWGAFESRDGYAQLDGEECVGAPSRVLLPAAWLGTSCWGVGSGFVAYTALTDAWRDKLERLVPDCYPRATEIARLAVHDGLGMAVSAADALPVYLRDDVATVPSQN